MWCAPVVAHLWWDEALSADITPDRYIIGSIFRRREQIDDLSVIIADEPLYASALTRAAYHVHVPQHDTDLRSQAMPNTSLAAFVDNTRD